MSGDLVVEPRIQINLFMLKSSKYCAQVLCFEPVICERWMRLPEEDHREV